MWPACSGSPPRGGETGSGVDRARISGSLLRTRSPMCTVTSTGTGSVAGSSATSSTSASIEPAEPPTATTPVRCPIRQPSRSTGVPCTARISWCGTALPLAVTMRGGNPREEGHMSHDLHARVVHDPEHDVVYLTGSLSLASAGTVREVLRKTLA